MPFPARDTPPSMLPYAHDAPEADPTLLRPRITRLANRLARVLAHDACTSPIRLEGASGAGRSTLLFHVGRALTQEGHQVVRWDASRLPQGASPMLDLAGRIVADWPEPHRAASKLRVPLRTTFDAVHRDRAQPAWKWTPLDLGEAWRAAAPERSLFLLLDGCDDAAPGTLDALLRGLPDLLDASGARVVATWSPVANKTPSPQRSSSRSSSILAM
jgi:hypothetical protein